MREQDERDLFKDVNLAEPSPEVDRRILALAAARALFHADRRPRRWASLAGLLPLAAAVALGLLLFVFWEPPRPREPGPTSSAPVAPASVGNVADRLSVEIIDLRRQLEAMEGEAEAIPSARERQKAVLLERIRTCLSDLERVEYEIEWKQAEERERRQGTKENEV